MPKKLIIIDNIWSPYNHARYSEIARQSQLKLKVFYHTKTDNFRKWERDDREECPYEVHFLNNICIPLSVSTALSLNINYDVYGQLKKEDPDRIIVCGWDSFATLAAVLYARRFKKEIILWAGSTVHEKSLVRSLTLPYVKFLIKRFDGFISYGTAAADYLRQLGAKGDIVHFYNTVDVDFYRENAALSEEKRSQLQKTYNVDPESIVIMFSGRLVKIKQVDMLIKTFLELTKEHEKLDLIIAGYGPEKEDLEALAGPSGKVHFTGSLQAPELAQLYGLSDILVLPSHSEPWGLVANEAMASGCAVIVSANCGCAVDLVKDNGYVFDTYDAEDLKSKLTTLIDEPPKLAAMKEASLRAIENFKPGDLVKSVPYFME